MDRPQFTCPHCASHELTELAAKTVNSFTAGLDGQPMRFAQTTYVLQCACGVVITRMTRRPAEQAGTMFARKIAVETVAAAIDPDVGQDGLPFILAERAPKEVEAVRRE